MCEYNSDANYQPPGAKYSIQRSWSNAAAKAGTNPCVPVPASSSPYFNSYPDLSDTITLHYDGNVATKGVKIAVGASKTIDVKLSSPGNLLGTWRVTAYDLGDYLGSKANTTLALDKSVGKDGDVLKLTITVKSYNAQGGAGFVLESTSADGQDNMIFGAVGQ